VTKYSPTGTLTRGTLNNCGTGKTPWGTLLTGEENWAGYFTRPTGDDAARGNDKSVTSLKRYGAPKARHRATAGKPAAPTTSTSAGTSLAAAPRPTAATTTATR
jgi:secreted PhoX family phosphatase